MDSSEQTTDETTRPTEGHRRSVEETDESKKRWKPGLDHDAALRVAAEALIDAADDDSATGGPDAVRGLWPIMVSVTAAGATDVPEADVIAAVDTVLAERRDAS